LTSSPFRSTGVTEGETVFLFLLRRKYQSSAAIRARPPRPPITPPTMAPILEPLEALGEALAIAVWLAVLLPVLTPAAAVLVATAGSIDELKTA
jgi:hypothetical protein